MSKQPTKNYNQHVVLAVILTLVLITIYGFIGSLKTGFHIDELYSLGMSNQQFVLAHTIGPAFQNGKVYSGQELLQKYTTVSYNKSFDYANVLNNYAHDVHPPLYSILLHTVSSLFPHLPLVWMGLLINIPLACLIFWQLVWLVRQCRLSRAATLAIPFCFTLMMGFVNDAVIYIRMYILFAMWVNLLAMLYVKYKPNDSGSISYYVALGLIILGGMLTHHYFLVYTFLASCVYGYGVLRAKRYGKILLSLLSGLLAYGIGLVIFPSAWSQIFSSYRARAAWDSANAIAWGAWHKNLVIDLRCIDSSIFGGYLAVVLLVAASFTAFLLLLRKTNDEFLINRGGGAAYC